MGELSIARPGQSGGQTPKIVGGYCGKTDRSGRIYLSSYGIKKVLSAVAVSASTSSMGNYGEVIRITGVSGTTFDWSTGNNQNTGFYWIAVGE